MAAPVGSRGDIRNYKVCFFYTVNSNMKINRILETSIIVSFILYVYGIYISIERKIDDVYKDSVLYRLISEFSERIKIYFKYSFFGRITEINQEENSLILDSSKVVQWVMVSYKKNMDKIVNYSNMSSVSGFAGQIKSEFDLLPVKTGGIIVVIAVLVDIILSIMLQKDVSLLGWIVRGVLLFVGAGGIFNSASWDEIKNTSIALRYLKS